MSLYAGIHALRPVMSQTGQRFGFVTLGSNVPSTRFRFFAFQQPLESLGHKCRIWTSYPSVYDYFTTIGWRLSYQLKKAVRTAQWLDACRYKPDCIYLERGCFHDDSLFMDKRFRRTTKRLVLDVDDGIFLQFPDKIKQLMEMSDHVIVSNKPIYDYVRQYHDRVTEIPTSVSLARYQLKPSIANTTGSLSSRKPVIGWIGTTSNLHFMSVCAEALRAIAKKHDYELLIIAPTDVPLASIDLSGVSVRFVNWSPDTEIELLHQMDIGIMPLPDNQDWMRYKAATKLIQYLSIGIPAVASPIGVNADILENNRVGFAARNTAGWIDSLDQLLSDSSLRHLMGQQGRELVERRFSIEANTKRLEAVLSGTEE